MICDILFLLRVYNILLTTIQTGGSYFVQSIETTLQAFQIGIQVSFLYLKKKKLGYVAEKFTAQRFIFLQGFHAVNETTLPAKVSIPSL